MPQKEYQLNTYLIKKIKEKHDKPQRGDLFHEIEKQTRQLNKLLQSDAKDPEHIKDYKNKVKRSTYSILKVTKEQKI